MRNLSSRLVPKYTRRMSWLTFFSIMVMINQAKSQEQTYTAPDVNIFVNPEQVFELPGSGDYIGPERIQKYNFSNINDILRETPGVYSREETGFMKVWINNKLVLNSENIKNITPYTKRGVGLDFGIYQTFVSGWKREHGEKPYPNMVVYFDEVNLGSTKEKVTKNLGN